MSLFDPTFLKFDGMPDTGRIPTSLEVVGGNPLTQAQLFGVRQVYEQFNMVRRLSVHDFHTEHYVLADGTRVHIWSLQNRTEVVVEPAVIGSGREIPHGFLVLSSYSDPAFYCRAIDGSWTFHGIFVPQAEVLPIFGTNLFIHDLTANEYTVHPSVLVPGSVWDWEEHEATSQDKDLPVITKTGSQENIDRPHFPVLARGNKIKKMTGETLFTMVDEVPWWAYIYPDEQYGGPPSTVYWDPTYVRPVTDTAGSVVIFNGFRFHTFVGVAETEYVQCQGASVNIGVNDTYTPTYTRNVFSPPLLTQPVEVRGAVTYDLNGEVPSGAFILYGMNLGIGGTGWYPSGWCGPATSYALAGGYFWWDVEPVWRVPQGSNWLDKIGSASYTVGQPYGAQGTLTRDFEYSAGPEIVIDGVAVVPGTTGPVTAKLKNRISYPSKSLFRSGYMTRYAENISGAWDYYGVEGKRIERREALASMDACPSLTLEMGSIQIVLFEGNSTYNLTGRYYRDWDIRRFSATVRDWASHGTIVRSHNGIPAPARPTGLGQSTYYGSGYQEIYEGATWTTEEVNEAGWGGTPRMDTSTPFELVHEEIIQPEETASYWFKSRYIIDCDTRAGVVVSIVVEVISSGAKWVQGDWYMGLLSPSVEPSYTVNILAECQFRGMTTTKLLLTGNCTRWAIEYLAAESMNPYVYTGAGGSPSMYIFRSPEASPPRSFYTQLMNLASCQSGNTNLAAADNIPQQPASSISETGLEFTEVTSDGFETALTRTAAGMIYTRVIKIGDFPDALWLLRDLKIDARENDIQNEALPKWHYMPEFGAKLENDYHVISIRDGQFVEWTEDIKNKVVNGASVPTPLPKDRNIKLYRV